MRGLRSPVNHPRLCATTGSRGELVRACASRSEHPEVPKCVTVGVDVSGEQVRLFEGGEVAPAVLHRSDARGCTAVPPTPGVSAVVRRDTPHSPSGRRRARPSRSAHALPDRARFAIQARRRGCRAGEPVHHQVVDEPIGADRHARRRCRTRRGTSRESSPPGPAVSRRIRSRANVAGWIGSACTRCRPRSVRRRRNNRCQFDFRDFRHRIGGSSSSNGANSMLVWIAATRGGEVLTEMTDDESAPVPALRQIAVISQLGHHVVDSRGDLSDIDAAFVSSDPKSRNPASRQGPRGNRLCSIGNASRNSMIEPGQPCTMTNGIASAFSERSAASEPADLRRW